MTLNTQTITTLDQVRAFLDGTRAVTFHVPSSEQRYHWIRNLLRQFGYTRLSRPNKGVLQRFILKVTGYSRQQLTRLIAQWRQTGSLRDRRGPPARPFQRRYTDVDVRLLCEIDTLHGTLSGPATKKLAERAYHVFGDARYQRLATISVAHLYHLRSGAGYRRQRGQVEKTRSRQIAIGERRCPQPNGKPGYLRVDSVHQGDWDGIKGLYLINLVDATTQWQIVAAVERISEHYLLSVLQDVLTAFPFVIRGFHSDNGSEYINHQVARLLDKLRIEFTKSRARHTNDNALVESKNGSVVRKHLGYSHIPGHFAPAVNAFTRDVLTPYLNLHRPCFFPLTVIDEKGRQRKRYLYQDMNTPYEKMKQLDNAEQYLKPNITFQHLDHLANAMTDNQAAHHLNQKRKELFDRIFKSKNPPPATPHRLISLSE